MEGRSFCWLFFIGFDKWRKLPETIEMSWSREQNESGVSHVIYEESTAGILASYL
jgi:hypothetical protein